MLGINTNVSSLTAQRNLTGTTSAMSTTLQRLSSGLRINSAKDDAAGMAISTRMTAQIRGLDQARRNANDGISLAQTAEGALSEIGNNLQRIRELTVQAANATNSASDKATIQSEVDQLTAEITRVGNQTQFNGTNLLDGSFVSKQFQVGASSGQTIDITKIGDARSAALGSNTLAGVGTITDKVATTNAVTAVTNADNFSITTADGGKSANIVYADGSSAKDIAAAINTGASGVGVTATASNSTTIDGLSAAGTVSFTLNGANISADITNEKDLTALAAAINGASGSTGITAELKSATDKSGLVLKTSDGRDINLGAFANSAAGATDSMSFGGTTLTEGGTIAAVKVGRVDLASNKGAMTLAGGSTEVFATATAQSSFSSVAGINLTAANGPQNALDVLDAALASVSATRADLGAYQNRFSSAIANLQTTSENLSASRSRIQDTDFAAETANLSRNQVLQQAGTAMLAQANQGPQIALQLLR